MKFLITLSKINISLIQRRLYDMNKRISRVINAEEQNELLQITSKEACKMSVFMNLFASFEGKPPRFNTYDIMTIPAGTFGPEGLKNKNDVITTVGRFIFNKAFIEDDLVPITGYVNKDLTKKNIGAISEQVAYAVNEDRIPVEIELTFLLKQQKFMAYTSVISVSTTVEMFNASEPIGKKKKELLPKYQARIDAGDPLAGVELENELLAFAKEYFKDDPAMDYYDCGLGSWGNNFKNTYVMKGAAKDPITGKYNVLLSNYIDGVDKKEYSAMANSLAAGPYARARKTMTGGYNEKKYVLAFQNLVTGPKGSDCGTKDTIEVTLKGKYLSQMMYSYIQEGDKLIRLDSSTVDKYKGKTVKMRFCSLCKGVGETKQFCNKCIGDYFYMIGMPSVGIASAQMQSKIKNIAMKAFHDGVVKYTDIDLAKAFPDE